MRKISGNLTLTHEDVTEQKRVEEQIASLIANAT
jgi:hypothetical protein